MPVFIPLARHGQVAPASAKPALTPKEALAAKTKAHAAKSKGAPVSVKTPEAPKPAAFEAALVNAGADEAVAALAQAGEGATALVDAWAAASNGAALVEAAESEAVNGAARKAARRAINVLRSRGVSIPTRARVVKIEPGLEAEAAMSPPDAMGALLFSITRREPSGRYHIGELVVREPFGIVEAGAGWLSGSQLKENRNRSLEGFGTAPVPVPLEWARHRIAAARKLNGVSGQVLPLGLERFGDLLDPVPEAAPAHPLASLEAEITAERAAAAAAASESLHNEPEFRGWLPDQGALQELIHKVSERLTPGETPSNDAIDAFFSEEMSAATDRFFLPEVRAIVADRMRDAAISIRARKGDRAAADVLGVARAVREAGLITAPPRDIPFLVAFFRTGLGYLAQQNNGQIRLSAPGAGAPQASPPSP
jgi:hypothetical protein